MEYSGDIEINRELEYSSSTLSRAIYLVNLLVSDIEHPPLVKDCLWEYGCEHHIKKMVNDLKNEAKTKPIEDIKDCIIKNNKSLNEMKECLIKNNAPLSLLKFFPSDEYEDFETMDLAGSIFDDTNLLNFPQDGTKLFNQKAEDNSSAKQDGPWNGKMDMAVVWKTEQPVMFGFIDRRISFTKAELSFCEEEFSAATTIKSMIIGLVDGHNKQQ